MYLIYSQCTARQRLVVLDHQLTPVLFTTFVANARETLCVLQLVGSRYRNAKCHTLTERRTGSADVARFSNFGCRLFIKLFTPFISSADVELPI